MWAWCQGRKKIKNVTADVKVNNHSLEQTHANDAEKTLGVHVSPSLQWIKHFAEMEEKMKRAMWKVKRTPMTIGNACVFYNVCLLMQVYFGCGIVKLMPQQEARLMKISEAALLKKLGLGEKFPRDVLCIRNRHWA